MKAVVVHGANDLRIDDRPEPVAGAGEVVIASNGAGSAARTSAYWRHGASGTAVLKSPLVLGHEVAGRIAAAGRRCHDLEVGPTRHRAPRGTGRRRKHARADRRAAPTSTRASATSVRRPLTRTPTAASASCGSSARLQIRPLPDGVDTLRGALAEPLAVAMHAVSRAGTLSGRDVLVNGAGPIGSLVVAAAKYGGARTVIAVDINDAPAIEGHGATLDSPGSASKT